MGDEDRSLLEQPSGILRGRQATFTFGPDGRPTAREHHESGGEVESGSQRIHLGRLVDTQRKRNGNIAFADAVPFMNHDDDGAVRVGQ